MIQQRPCSVLPGDALPFCFGMASDRRFWSSEEQAGRAAVLILIGRDAAFDVKGVIDDFVGHSDALSAHGADLLLMGDEDAIRVPLPGGFRAIDCGAEALAQYGVAAGEVVVLVVDRNRRVALRRSPQFDSGVATACLASLNALPAEPARDVVLPAPILILPNLIPPELCRSLMELFEHRPNMEGEVATLDHDGIPRSRVDRAKKSRRDMPIAPEDALYPILRNALLQRCAPEIARAFQVKVAHLDRVIVARYDDTGGWFRRHRDNVGENVAFREFAVSVNLNTDYEGGHLLFPEYNDHRYRPPAGAAAIFSGAVLHEVAPVTRGQRYVLLTFIHGDAAEARRLEYQARQTLAAEASPARSARLTSGGS